jgi:hypothetical protein
MNEILLHMLIVLPFFIFNGWVTVKIYKRNQRRQDKKFLRYIKIRFPDATQTTLTSVAASDEEALTRIKEQLDELP